MSLQFYVRYVSKNLINVTDDVIRDVYMSVYVVVNDEEICDVVKRSDMIKFVKKNIASLDESDVLLLTRKISKSIANEKKVKEKREIMLDILNQILAVLEKDELVDLIDFSVQRNQLIGDECKKIIDDNNELIFKHFDKGTKHRDRKRIKYGHVSLIKDMLKQIGYSLCTSHKSKMCQGEKFFYSIYYIKKH